MRKQQALYNLFVSFEPSDENEPKMGAMCNRPNVTVLCLKTVYITKWKFSSSPTFQRGCGPVSAGWHVSAGLWSHVGGLSGL